MINGKRIVAVVTARGGSKGVPRKNIRLLAGRPLLAYTADQARAVDGIDCVALTTDDAEIGAVGQSFGWTVIDRPAELARDESRSELAILHALDTLESSGVKPFDIMLLLQPTSPLRTTRSIRGCLDLLIETGAPSLVTVTRLNECVGGIVNGRFVPLSPEDRKRRQDRPARHLLNGCIFACTVDHLRRTGELMCDDWLAYEVSWPESLDIDTMHDFEHAQYLMSRSQGEAT